MLEFLEVVSKARIAQGNIRYLCTSVDFQDLNLATWRVGIDFIEILGKKQGLPYFERTVDKNTSLGNL